MAPGERLPSDGGSGLAAIRGTTATTNTATKRDTTNRIFASSTSPPRHSSDQHSSPPTTPQNRTSRLRGIKAPRNRPSIRDAFDNGSHLHERSNSNGLSWSPKHARNSVVDNMLLSLDNFETGVQDYQTDYQSLRSTGSCNSERDVALDRAARNRGPTVSPANSPDNGSPSGNPPAQIRHRSNSTANYQSSLGRIDSVRINGQQEDKTAQRKSKQSGRDSGSSSLDLERPDARFRPNRRSQSFDLGRTRMALKTTLQDPFTYDQGPGLAPAVPVIPRTSASAALRPATSSRITGTEIRRRGSTRSPVRTFAVSMESQNTQEPLSQDSHNMDTASKMSAGLTPSPSVPAKENQKPGFFRRMFGSSASPSDNAPASKRLTRPPASMRQLPVDETVDVSQLQRTSTRDRSKEAQPLNKKTSFFRRRRKSIQDAPVPQLPELYRDPEDTLDRGHPDSPGSLQKVLDQYYESHRRLDSRGSMTASRRKNSIPSSNVFSTIRAVPASAASSIHEVPKLVSRASLEQPVRTNDVQQHRRSTSEGSKLDPADKGKSSMSEKSKPSPTHTRTQSDIDKNLPRLPVDYAAIKSDLPKEVPTSKYNPASSKPVSRGSTTSTAHSAANVRSSSRSRLNEALLATPESKVNVEQKHTPTKANTKVNEIEDRAEEVEDLADETREALLFSVQDVDAPTKEQRAFAQKLFDGTSTIDKTEVAPWLGETDEERANIRQAYMELFDWKDMSILGAMRSLCNHLQLKGETQQVDRLLDALSRRWCDCNPKHGFKATDVVHTICYSILLLNTDLHMADIEQKMTRNQFIKNTMPTIRRVVIDAAPNAFDNARSSMLPPARRTIDAIAIHTGMNMDNPIDSDARPSHRLQSRPSDHSGHDSINDQDECGPLVTTSFTGKIGAWEAQVELVLKNFYTSIRNQRLPLSGQDEDKRLDPANSSQSLSAPAGGLLRRTNSMLSKAGSETLPVRGRFSDSRIGTRWSTKGRSRARLYPASLAQSRTSLDDGESTISPSLSSMWSKHSLGKTSMSVTSFASGFSGAEYQRSIGFANALSQAITRDDPVDNESTEEFLRVGPLLEDESLELEGAPWAKEGMVEHKKHFDSNAKRAKVKNWTKCFAVIEKGWIRLFQFNMNAKSMRSRSQKIAGGVVGGGNWMENAQPLGQFLLRHTIAHALPPPGYSKVRPHVWALSLPNHEIHLFQVGTPEIVKEFVSTANYWSARLSKEPLTGGISNIEYGWSDRVINMALIDSSSRPPSQTQGPSRPSMSQSLRTSFEQSSTRTKLPGDKVALSDWLRPTQSTMSSQLLEVDQLRALQTYVSNIEEELQKHNELRSAMLLAFTPRQNNHTRAMNNWQQKSEYLLRETTKFKMYIESLQFAQKESERVKLEKKVREEEKLALAVGRGEGLVHELVGSTPLADGKEVVGV